MEFDVKENVFYILLYKHENPNLMTIFDELEPSVKKVKEHLKNGVNTESLELMSVHYKNESFEIKSIPWNIISMELVKE